MIIGLLVGLVVCIIPIAILVLIISAVVKKGKENKNNFEESIRNIYVYIILIITLISIIAGTIASLRVGLDIILPEEELYQNSYNNMQQKRNGNINELFTNLSLVISVIPIFMYHNKLAKKSRATKTEEINEN